MRQPASGEVADVHFLIYSSLRFSWMGAPEWSGDQEGGSLAGKVSVTASSTSASLLATTGFWGASADSGGVTGGLFSDI